VVHLLGVAHSDVADRHLAFLSPGLSLYRSQQTDDCAVLSSSVVVREEEKPRSRYIYTESWHALDTTGPGWLVRACCATLGTIF
jgi:hypothetical protein